ncbi:MAG: chemotaxis protein CheW [Chromatiaceae bacterium]
MNHAAAETKAGDTVTKFVTFRLMDETYGIDVMQVQEVLRVTEIAPVPGAAEFVLGIINLRGNVVTVIDTRTRFGLPTTEQDEASRIVIIEAEDQVIGILVDSVAEVVELHESEISPAPQTGNEENSRYIQGVVSREDDLLIVIDLNRFLSEQEWSEMAVLQGE